MGRPALTFIAAEPQHFADIVRMEREAGGSSLVVLTDGMALDEAPRRGHDLIIAQADGAVARLALRLAPLLFVLLAAACASSAGAPEARPPSSTTALSTSAAWTATSAPASPTPPPAASPPPTSTQVQPAAGTSITMSAVGDISLARQVADRMEANGGAYPFALMAGLMTGDIGFANLEGALTERGEPWPKGYNFRTAPRFAPWLFAAHFDVVTLANNHTLDFGQTGLLDTLAALDAAGVRYVGAGTDAASAHAPVIAEAHGLRVAFLGYVATPDEGGGFSIRAWEAGPNVPGLALGSAEAIAAGVAAARRTADFVIVAVHAGDEYRTAPNAAQRALAEAALAAGADAYVGAHAHVVQPIEMRGGQLIAWGLGNFIFDLDDVDLANIPVPRVSLILKLTLTKGAGVTAWQAIPVTQDAAEDRPRPATADEAAALREIIGPDRP